MDVFVDLAELIDVTAEIARKKQEVEKLDRLHRREGEEARPTRASSSAPRPTWCRKSATASPISKTNSPPSAASSNN